MQQIKIDTDCQFLKDLSEDSMQGRGVNRGMYNLICSKRDLSLFCNDIKPHRRWRLKDVKNYFGITGNKEAIKDKLNKIFDVITKTKTKGK